MSLSKKEDWCMPPRGYRRKRNIWRYKGPSHLWRYGGRTAPIPDSFINNTTCASGRNAYPQFLTGFFLQFPILSGTDLCPFSKSMVENGVFLRGLRNKIGGPSCFPQALCDKKKQVCDGAEKRLEGMDSDANTFTTREVMWEIYTGDEEGREEWYTKSMMFWNEVDASVNGMLCGYGRLSSRDLMGSHKFLMDCFKTLKTDWHESRVVALDCGAGIGRITKNLLVHFCDEVDLVEPIQRFLELARRDLHFDFMGTKLRNVNYFHYTLQDFVPPAERYDFIWMQWCIAYLTDVDLVELLKRAKLGLKPGGFIIVKENIAKSGFVLDKEDASVTRSDAYFRTIFQESGLYVYKHRKQNAFPRELFEVRMYCLTAEFKKKKKKSKKGKTESKPIVSKSIKEEQAPVDPHSRSLWGWGWGNAFSKENEGALRKKVGPPKATERPVTLASCSEQAWETGG
ncbi:hypothetical protein R1sor_021334 [Riccia sorocarpa]|uniref:Alpha N-terminal protein methyltransferase 1 n=1 Tax=Riccia sorocarpa TaxID=122646 RepID=A0ABD3GGU1_9MARC